MPLASRPRDPRVDVLRGAALLMIFVDHIPDDALNVATLHNFGFCDAAEIFVLLAGFSSMMAYGAKFDRHGLTSATLGRIAARCGKIYLMQAALLFLTLVTVWLWSQRFQIPAATLAPLVEDGAGGLIRALTLRALPGFLDILPLYIVLLAAFPLLYLAMRRHMLLGLGLSGLVWVAANLDHDLNLPNSIDGHGWYFNPFTWQLLFAIGAAAAVLMARRGDVLPRRGWLVALCCAYLGFAFLQGATWEDWHLPSLRLLDMPPPDKSHLSPLRILDVLALLYLIASSPGIRAWANGRVAGAIALFGRHSLEVFTVGCAGALFARLLFRTNGNSLALQVGVNVIGIGSMFLVAWALEHSRAKKRDGATPTARRRGDVRFQQGEIGVYRAG